MKLQSTTNDFEARSRGKMSPRWFSCNYKRLKLNYKQVFRVSGELQTKWIKLQNTKKILMLEFGVKNVLVRFQETTNENGETKNNYKLFWTFSSKVNGSTYVFDELQTIKTQLQTIVKLKLGMKWLHVVFWGTTNDKNKTTNNFKAQSTVEFPVNTSSKVNMIFLCYSSYAKSLL